MPTMNPRITFAVSDDLIKKIDAFRFENRLRNQTQAIIALINLGFESLSGGKLQPQFTEEQIRFIDAYNAADERAQEDALTTLINHPTQKKEAHA